jgi:hypothetical protein
MKKQFNEIMLMIHQDLLSVRIHHVQIFSHLTPHAFWNISDIGIMCEKCDTINTITLENGELRRQVLLL